MGSLVALLAIAAVLWICFLATRLDPYPRTELREVLWPRFRRERKRTTAVVSVLVCGLGSVAILGLLPLWPALVFAAQLAGSLLGSYVLFGCMVIVRNAGRLLGRNTLAEDPVHASLRYLLSWPIWHKNFTGQGLPHLD
jgi:hypothetical protein